MSGQPEDRQPPRYGIERRNGQVRIFRSRSAAQIFNRDLPPLALQYKKGVVVSRDGGATWEPL